jgi:hypothetical protein
VDPAKEEKRKIDLGRWGRWRFDMGGLGRPVCKYVTVQGRIRKGEETGVAHGQSRKKSETVPRERFKGEGMGGKY